MLLFSASSNAASRLARLEAALLAPSPQAPVLLPPYTLDPADMTWNLKTTGSAPQAYTLPAFDFSSFNSALIFVSIEIYFGNLRTVAASAPQSIEYDIDVSTRNFTIYPSMPIPIVTGQGSGSMNLSLAVTTADGDDPVEFTIDPVLAGSPAANMADFSAFTTEAHFQFLVLQFNT